MGAAVRRRLNVEAGQNPAFFSGFVRKVSTLACAWTGIRLTVYLGTDENPTPPAGKWERIPHFPQPLLIRLRVINHTNLLLV